MTTLNVDPAEIAKFEELASRWWDSQGEFKPLHEINPLRLQYIDQRVGLSGKKILDVGCGGGILAESMAQNGAHVLGIDMGKAPLTVAKLHAMEAEVELEYRQITVEELAEEMPAQFDAVTCMEMLEHVPDPASIIRACYKLVKPGGDVFMSTLNRNPKSFMFAVIGAEYLLQMLPKGTHDYKKFIKPSELSSWAREAGLELKDISGLSYNPLTKVYKLSRDVSVNYMTHNIRPAE
ncbi:MAG: bifunctional 2-polyprenyl-6-hydroxyphenol methylase/3-demethylubiquinol 3-O-methyltransferase UbiG [Gammaproteobacteria bacterium]|nr:bifunctional 2-polyprenyl-6-hydroxyphenol methylase/3-demethylubiquinol 3-O-methyltransferase UbiG [Gammaproteobacteria bacterium]